MAETGRLLLIVGAVLCAVGLLLILSGKAGVPLGRMPGDMVYRGKHTTFYFPLMTSVILSVVLSLVLYFLGRGR